MHLHFPPPLKRPLIFLLAGCCLAVGGCKPGTFKAVWIYTNGCEYGSGTGPRPHFKWEGFATRDDDAICVFYIDFTRPRNFTITSGWNHDDRWIDIDGTRLDLRERQCILVTNGRDGRLLQTVVPWMKLKDLQKKEGGLTDEQLIPELFAPLASQS